MQYNSVSTVSPSFTSYSSNNLADIAARVVEEFRNENGGIDDDDIYNFTDDDSNNQFYNPPDDDPDATGTEKWKQNEDESDENEEFEFAVVCNLSNSNSSPISAGEILPKYPLFDRSLLLDESEANSNSKPSPVVRHPLRKLFIEERERDSPSCSSSEADDLDGVTPGTYCIWKPKVEESPERCKKSNSTGNTSKRWKLRNLLHRSNSDNFTARKDASVVVFSPKKRSEKVKKVEKTAKVAGAADDGEPTPVTDKNNSGNKTDKGANRIRSYKQDLVGVFAKVNGLNRNLNPL